MTEFNEFLGDDAGAVAVDWIVLTAGILVVGMVVIYAILNGGMASAVIEINSIATDLTSIDVGTPPDPVSFGG
jgi:hypothetical protein